MLIGLPHRKVLILASICISVILVSVSTQIMLRSGAPAPVYSGSITAEAGESEESNFADQRVLDALEQARAEELGELASSSNPFEPSPKDSISDRFSKDIFSAFLKYQEAGGEISDEELARDAISNIKTDGLPKPKYNLSDVRIFAAKNKDDLYKYGNEMAKRYIETIAPVSKDPESYSKRVSNMSPIYRGVGEQFIQVSVPSDISSAHLELTNSFIILADTFPIIDNQPKDPVKALLGLRVVQDTLPKQVELFTEISDYFNRNGILFSKEEYGAMWNPPSQADVSTAPTASSSKSN